MNDAVTEGAKRYSDDPRAFLDEFNATKRDSRVRLGEGLNLVIRLPHTARLLNAPIGMFCKLKVSGC